MDGGIGSPQSKTVACEAAARLQAERHYQVAVSHTERGSLAPACRALSAARQALAPHDSALPATPMSPSSLEPALPGVMAADDLALSLASIDHLERRLVKHLSDLIHRSLTAALATEHAGGEAGGAGLDQVAEAAQTLSDLLPTCRLVPTLSNVLATAVETLLDPNLPVPPSLPPHMDSATFKMEECQRMLTRAACLLPGALTKNISQVP